MTPIASRTSCGLHYEVRGAGPPVLFIQGVGVHGGGWRPQADALESDYECLWFDNRGMGASQPAPNALTVEAMAVDALAVMDAHGWPAAHVVGHSLGGLVAQYVALAAPHRVLSLSLLCTFGRGADAGRSARMLWLGLRTRVGTRRMRRHAFLEMVMPPESLANADLDALAGRLVPLFGHDLADHPPNEMQQLSAMRKADAMPRLGRLAGLPTLVVSASHDPVAPPALGQALAAAIPGARFVLLSDASHGVTIEQPERINVLLREHLDNAVRGTRNAERMRNAEVGMRK